MRLDDPQNRKLKEAKFAFKQPNRSLGGRAKKPIKIPSKFS